MRAVVTFLRRPRFANGTWFRFPCLPHKVIRRGFRCLLYLDDLLTLLQANAFVHRRVRMLLDMLGCFGLAINEAKSCLQPRARFEHLGLGVDLRKREF